MMSDEAIDRLESDLNATRDYQRTPGRQLAQVLRLRWTPQTGNDLALLLEVQRRLEGGTELPAEPMTPQEMSQQVWDRR